MWGPAAPRCRGTESAHLTEPGDTPGRGPGPLSCGSQKSIISHLLRPFISGSFRLVNKVSGAIPLPKIAWGLVHFSAEKRISRANGWPKTWTCPLPAARGATGSASACLDATLAKPVAPSDFPRQRPSRRENWDSPLWQMASEPEGIRSDRRCQQIASHSDGLIKSKIEGYNRLIIRSVD